MCWDEIVPQCELSEFILANIEKSGRARLCGRLVMQCGYRTVEQVRLLSFRELATRNFGRKSFNLLKAALAEAGYVTPVNSADAAVLAERERCARIAEGADYSDQVHCADCNNVVASGIAAKIRSGE